MRVGVDRREATASSVDVIATGFVERPEKDEGLPRSLAGADALTGGLLAAAWRRREVRGHPKEVTVFHRPDGRGRLALVGLGPREAVDVDSVRRAAADAVRAFRGRGARTIGFPLGAFVVDGVAADQAAEALVEGSCLGSYEFTRYRAPRESGVEEVTVFLGREHAREETGIRKAVDHGQAISDAVLWTRDLTNLPADTATPERIAEEARQLGHDLGLKVTVFDEKKLADLHCGGLLG
ncbi:MAG TPA: M17 family peptidase N-terminal domain-containing protein, partial [Thermoplasmata archaeon]|nr:M17 family peptidase N-terminal domain-containing protein [Thermoplasmata archaeon]